MDRLKELCVSDEGWSFDKEKSGVIIAHRYQDDSPIVMLVSLLSFFFFFSQN